MRVVLVVCALIASTGAFAQAKPAEAKPAEAKPAEAKPAEVKPAASGKTEITWIGHAAFVVKTPAGTTLLVDPFIKNNPVAPKDFKAPDKIDAILVSHGHGDHSGDARELADKTGAMVIGSFELVSLIGAKNNAGGNSGGAVAVKDDVVVHMVEAVHSSSYGDGPNQKYSGAPLGFVIAIKGGPSIYHSGDTDAFSSMDLIGKRYKPTIGLLAIGGHFTMDPTGASHAAKMLGVKTVIPMHFGTFPPLKGTPADLTAALKKTAPAAKVVEMKPGETKQF